jgi:hypothetical protein
MVTTDRVLGTDEYAGVLGQIPEYERLI